MTKKSIAHDILVIASPIIVQNLVQYIQLQVDMAMLGRYNLHFLSAIGNVLFPYTIMYAFLAAISTGATVLIAHTIGAGALKSARRYSEVSFFYNALIAIPMFAILYFFAVAIMRGMGTSPDIVQYGSIYMRVLAFSFLSFSIELSVVAILIGMGKTKAIMQAAIIRTIVNIALDWTLIYGNLGFPEAGIKGAALATTISNFSAAFYLVIYYLADKKLSIKPTLYGIFKPKWSIEINSIKIGLPYGLEAMLWSFGQLILIRLINIIDPYAAGSYVLIARIQAITFFFYVGLARGTLTLVGQSMGAGKRKEAIHTGMVSLYMSLIICVIAAVLFTTIPDKILSIFTTEHDLISRLQPLMFIIAINVFPVSVNVVIGNAIRGMKDTLWMFYTQSFGTLFVIGMSSLMLFVFQYKLTGIFITILTDEIVRSVLNFWRFYKTPVS
ncbi:MAG: MATE family efflux transporter [Bacteroidales bacterium]|nr:MATE family efflux transporter [Bacteroidales bacterium]